MHRLNLFFLTLLAILVMGCGSVATSPTDPNSSAPAPQAEPESPTAVPTAVIAATVEGNTDLLLEKGIEVIAPASGSPDETGRFTPDYLSRQFFSLLYPRFTGPPRTAPARLPR